MRTLVMVGLGLFGVLYLQKQMRIREKLLKLNRMGVAVAGFNNIIDVGGGCDYKSMSIEELRKRGC